MLCDVPMCDLPFTSTLTSLFLSENPEIFYFNLDILEVKSMILDINQVDNFDLDIEQSRSFTQIR